MNYLEKYTAWLKNAEDEKIKAELTAVRDKDSEIRERFFNDLIFGTAGLRGIMGAGTSRMNIYTVARVTEGLARYMKDTGGKSVVISYDTRNNSRLFADTARDVLRHFGISTYAFSEPQPVPLLSYAVRHMKADFGIMITASHNPKEYNGYKLYNSFGAQLTEQASAVIAGYIDKVPFFGKYKNAEAICIDGAAECYYKDIEEFFGGLKRASSADARIVYTSIHGSGLRPVRALFDRFGITYEVLERQADFDGNFPTVLSPNPENREALALAIEEAKKCGAEVVIATDPDADRMAAAVKDDAGEFCCLDGNQTGVLLMDYLLSMRESSRRAVVLKSFVSTDMVNRIAAKNESIEVVEVGVGFKNIAEKMRELEGAEEAEFFFGFEESCGYLAHGFCRDKDGVSAALLFALLAGHYKARGRSVLERLEELSQEYGYFADKSVSAYYEGLNGFTVMQKIMERLYGSVPEQIGGKKLLRARDYKAEHNSVYYELEGGSFVCVRPSGTEPKLKYYIGAAARTRAEAKELFDKIKADMECLTKA